MFCVSMYDFDAFAITSAVSYVQIVYINLGSFFCLSFNVLGSTYMFFYFAWSKTYCFDTLAINDLYVENIFVKILSLLYLRPLQNNMQLRDTHSGRVEISISYYFFFGGIFKLYYILQINIFLLFLFKIFFILNSRIQKTFSEEKLYKMASIFVSDRFFILL